jgi:predicted MFS family arabinose efflux permease
MAPAAIISAANRCVVNLWVIGEALGWQVTFIAIAICAIMTMVWLMHALPVLPSKNAGSLRSLPLIFARPALLALYAVTVIVVTAEFVAYSYIEPYAREVAGLDSQTTTAVLLVFGISGLLGSLLFGRYSERFPRGFLLAATVVLTACLLLLLPLAQNLPALYLLIVAWGAAGMCFGLVQQARELRLAWDAADVAMSLFSGLFNIGIGTGALLGGLVATHLGLAHVGTVGALLATVGLLVCVVAARRYPERRGG